MAQEALRVFLDANILFSASIPGSRLADFLRGLRGHAVLLTNTYAATEAQRNLAAKHPTGLVAHKRLMDTLTLVPPIACDPGVILADKDRPILCGAIAGGAHYLLTGDKRDFGHLFGTTVRGVKVTTVQMLLADLIKQGLVSDS